LRVVFAGTPVFAERALDRLLASRHQVVGVLTQPDRPSGRGQKLTASPVKARAVAAGLPVQQPPRLRDAAARSALQSLRPDVVVVAAYGLILPPAALNIAPHGCLNIHASLLPRWRGAAPIVRAIQAGDSETGVCIMRMEAGLDTGPVALTVRTPIAASDTAGSLHDRLANLGGEAIVQVLDAMTGVGTHTALQFLPQPETGATYAHKIDRAEAAIDWSRPAATVANHLRAFDPLPGAHSALALQPDLTIRCFSPSRPADVAGTGNAAAPAGTVLAVSADGLVVACGTGTLRVGELQRAGGRRLAVADFVRGHALEPGDAFIPKPAGAT
jgi:methionyl-tRNA formyltransferase